MRVSWAAAVPRRPPRKKESHSGCASEVHTTGSPILMSLVEAASCRAWDKGIYNHVLCYTGGFFYSSSNDLTLTVSLIVTNALTMPGSSEDCSSLFLYTAPDVSRGYLTTSSEGVLGSKWTSKSLNSLKQTLQRKPVLPGMKTLKLAWCFQEGQRHRRFHSNYSSADTARDSSPSLEFLLQEA